MTILSFIQTSSRWQLIQQLKKPWFWISLVMGAAISLVIYQEVLGKFWPPWSLRVKLSSLFLFVFFSAACFCLLNFFLLPRLKEFTAYQRAGIFVSSALIPLILVIAFIRLDIVFIKLQDFSKETIHFLLPIHTIKIKASATNLEGNEAIVLEYISTQAQGTLSPNALDIQGWERKGDQLFLTDPTENQIKWTGIVGAETTVVFKPTTGPANIMITWDGNQASYSLLTSTTQNVGFKNQFQVPFYAGWLPIAIALVLSILFFTLALLVGLLLFLPRFSASPSHKKWAWIFYAIPMVLTWSIYLMTFWPGFLSSDSIDQWQQMLTGEYVNWHPVAHTLTVWLVTHLWNSPAAMALLQIFALGGVLGWGIATLREIGLPAWMSWLVDGLLAILPSNSLLSITLWKDILFSTEVVALTILVLKIVATRGDWLRRKTSWLILGIVLALISLFGQNGFFVAFISFLMLTWAFRKFWKSLLKAAGLFLAIYLIFMGPVFQLLNVKSINMARYQVVLANLLAGQMKAGTYFSPQDRAILKPAFSEAVWPYDCYRNTSLIFGTNLDRDYLKTHTRDILNIAVKTTLENPGVTLWHFACQGDFVFFIPQGDKVNDPVYLKVFPNKFGLTQSSLIPILFAPLYNTIEQLLHNQYLMWILWRMPFWMYLCGLGCVLFSIKNRKWQPLLVLLPGLLTVLPYIVLSLGQIFRYVYSMYLIGILLSGYFWLCVFPKEYSDG